MNNKGVTIIEILIAIALIGVISILSTYFLSGFQLNSAAQYDTNMQAFSRSYMDDVRAYWSIAGNYKSNMLPINGSGQAVAPPTGYKYKVDVKTAVPSTTPVNIRSLTYAPALVVTAVNDVTPVPLKSVILTVTTPKGRVEVFTLQIAAPAGGGS
ncbi:prepilin-type N-terminal cleavage/methylation domain-containing protein [Deinococcus roseus]|uniref:Prepilin-type N-terminal cleavage/methylation domain-containing protein n=1 Tax=Deinococcus roseus TaxID=392414 RepID=A0ABQ2DD47_9DEIO|nr:prepilin-type N-terminal cleavage/methylation domain-containing protein [Deinococcus roseus]GGJ53976.1 hypothetical protein GCM10008938_45040 [Deinococcus roseus]